MQGMAGEKIRTIAVLLVMGVLAAVLLGLMVHRVLPYSFDSAGYIGAARSLRAGQGLVIPALGVEPVDRDTVPLKLQPAGYPFLIALAGATGMDENMAARAVPALAFVLLPLLFFLVLKQFLSRKAALLTAAVCTFMAPVMICGAKAWSDVPFLAATLCSLASLFHAIAPGELPSSGLRLRKGGGRYIFTAGCFAGYALLIRNTGYSLVGSVFVCLAAAALMGLLSKKDFFKAAALFVGGAALLYLPWLVRNFIVFHALQPYAMPPSELSFTDNLRQFLLSMAAFLAGGTGAGSGWIAGIAVAAVMVVLFFACCRHRRFSRSPRQTLFLWILGIHAAAGALLVIAARTRYRWGEEIGFRHVIQYGWVIVAYAAVLVGSASARFPAFRKWRAPVIIGLLPVFAFLQWSSVKRYIKDNTGELQAFDRLRESIPAIVSLPRDTYLISNHSAFPQILSKRAVRQLDNASLSWDKWILEGYYDPVPNPNAAELSPQQLTAKVTKTRDLAVILFMDDLSFYPRWEALLSDEGASSGFVKIAQGDGYVILFHSKI